VELRVVDEKRRGFSSLRRHTAGSDQSMSVELEGSKTERKSLNNKFAA
jgi:hypothetical protein